MSADLTDPKTHYKFGENWARFAEGLDEDHIRNAVAGLAKLLPAGLAGRSFLDIGCGSGINALAALRLGAGPVMAFDIDPEASATARNVLHRHAPGANWTVATRGIFDVAPGSSHYDIVFSWGVLHHTGALWLAIERSASLVAPGGHLVLATYRKTPMCAFWCGEKRIYAHGPAWFRAIAERTLVTLLVAGLLATGRNPVRYVRDYPRARGMEFMTDVRDWLGGYPYESASPAEVSKALERLGFERERFFPCSTRFGLLGVGCDQYVFCRC